MRVCNESVLLGCNEGVMKVCVCNEGVISRVCRLHYITSTCVYVALRVSILRVLHVMCPEIGLSTDQLFAWKGRVLTLMEHLGQQLQQERREGEENRGTLHVYT